MTTEILHASSPFDAIKRVRPDGSEYWSARELMPLMGYVRWENFLVPIARAQKATQNQGHDVASNFLRSQKVSGPRGPVGAEFELSRFGAYLVAMNGDPNKTEVAAAQGYFAIKTRQAEVAPKRLEIPADYPAALEEAARQARRALEAEAKVAELAPKAEAFDAFLCGEGLYLVGTVGRMLGVGQTSMFRFLYEQRVLIRVGARSKQPYANPRFDGWFRVRTHDQEHTNGHASTTTMVTPVGAEAIRLLAIEKGLIEPQLIALPSPGTKEIGA